MSGLEVVGAIASISQLAQHTGKLIICLRDLSENVHRSSEHFQNYKQRAEDLQQIVRLLEDNKELASDTVKRPIEALLHTIKAIMKTLAKKFVDPSNPSKRWKNWAKGARIPQAESFVSEKFNDLERHKSTLALALLENLGGYVQRIDARVASIPDIQRQVQKIDSTLRACVGLPADDGRRSLNYATRPPMPPHTQSDQASDYRRVDRELYAADDEPRPTLLSAHSTGSETLVPDHRSVSDNGLGGQTRDPKHTRYISAGRRMYTDNVALEESLQVNGHIGIREPTEHAYAYSHWSNNRAAGKSRQVNGDVFDTSAFFSRR